MSSVCDSSGFLIFFSLTPKSTKRGRIFLMLLSSFLWKFMLLFLCLLLRKREPFQLHSAFFTNKDFLNMSPLTTGAHASMNLSSYDIHVIFSMFNKFLLTSYWHSCLLSWVVFSELRMRKIIIKLFQLSLVISTRVTAASSIQMTTLKLRSLRTSSCVLTVRLTWTSDFFNQCLVLSMASMLAHSDLIKKVCIGFPCISILVQVRSNFGANTPIFPINCSLVHITKQSWSIQATLLQMKLTQKCAPTTTRHLIHCQSESKGKPTKYIRCMCQVFNTSCFIFQFAVYACSTC